MVAEVCGGGAEKTFAGTTVRIRTKTDTGRRGEHPKALERTVVKELGKLTPYVRKKGALLETEGAEKRLWRLFIKNTALC